MSSNHSVIFFSFIQKNWLFAKTARHYNNSSIFSFNDYAGTVSLVLQVLPLLCNYTKLTH